MLQHVENAIATTVAGTLQQNFHALVAIGQGTQQHRQIDAGQAFDASRFKELDRQVGGAGAKMSVRTSTPSPLSTNLSI
jgi:hypothetical protein